MMTTVTVVQQLVGRVILTVATGLEIRENGEFRIYVVVCLLASARHEKTIESRLCTGSEDRCRNNCRTSSSTGPPPRSVRGVQMIYLTATL